MAKKYLGIVLTTRRYDMYRFVVYQYEDTAMVNTCPLCQLLRAIHAYSKEYMEEQREIRGYVPRRRWFNLDNSTVVPGLASENRIIYTVLDDGKIVAVLILKDADEKKICTLRVAEHYRCQGIATKLLKIAHQALQCTNPLITVSSIHINEFEFLLKKNGFTLYKKYENYYKQGIVEYAFNGLLPEKQNDCRLSQNVV